MANSKISALTSAATVAGTEVLPIVQSSSTVKVAISDLNPGLSTILATKGGTGQTSYAVGDLLYASTTTALSKLADVATGNALISGGVGVAPSYGKIGLTTHVSGILPVANGGTNASSASITAFNNITGYSASGATGTTTTNLVFSTSPSITTPTLVGNATLSTGNLVISASGKGIAGTTTNNDADAGVVGEFVSSYVTSLVSMTSGTARNVTSISLTAGDWDVTGNIGFLPAATTSITALAGTIFTTSATYQDNSQYSFQDYYSSIIPGGSTTFYKTIPTVRFSLASTTTVYLIARASFSVSLLYHGSAFIRARRVR